MRELLTAIVFPPAVVIVITTAVLVQQDPPMTGRILPWALIGVGALIVAIARVEWRG